MSALAEQYQHYQGVRQRLFNAPAPAARPSHPRPVSPFVREAQARRRAQREAFDRQMFNADPTFEPVLTINYGWPPYGPVASYDEYIGTPTRKAPITMREIIREVAYKHRVTVNDILSERRARNVVFARHEAMWRCKQETTNSLPQIGRAFGGRDHSTAIHGIRKHEQRMREATDE